MHTSVSDRLDYSIGWNPDISGCVKLSIEQTIIRESIGSFERPVEEHFSKITQSMAYCSPPRIPGIFFSFETVNLFA